LGGADGAIGCAVVTGFGATAIAIATTLDGGTIVETSALPFPRAVVASLGTRTNGITAVGTLRTVECTYLCTSKVTAVKAEATARLPTQLETLTNLESVEGAVVA